MVFLGLLLAATAVTVATGVIMANDGAASLTVFGQAVPGVSDHWQVFVTGALVAVIFMIGMTMAFLGFGRLVRTRRDLRYLRDEHEETLTTLEMEKRRLQRELAQVRGNGAPGNPAAAPYAAPRPPAPRPSAPRPRPVHGDTPLAGAAARSSFFDRED